MDFDEYEYLEKEEEEDGDRETRSKRSRVDGENGDRKDYDDREKSSRSDRRDRDRHRSSRDVERDREAKERELEMEREREREREREIRRFKDKNEAVEPEANPERDQKIVFAYQARVCQTCGDKGFEELLLCCSKCQISEEHRYCLAEIPKSDDFIYICAQCVLSSVKPTKFKQSPSYHSEPSQRSRDTLQRNGGPPAIVQDQKKSEASCSSSVSERVVAVETRDLPASIQTPVSEPSVKDVPPEVGLNENDRSTHQCDVNSDGDQETKRKRRRFFHGSCKKSDEVVEGIEDRRIEAVSVAAVEPITTCDPLIVSSHNPVHDDPKYACARPLIVPAWRGCFEISGRKVGGLVAHLSDKACLKVVEAAGLMPAALCIKMMPRVDAWPKSFIESAPNDGSIGLYFFPESESVVRPYDELTHDIIRRDSVLTVLFENAVLLICPSNHLPPPLWRFDGKYYLWGVFRRRQVSQSHESGDRHIPAPGRKDFIECLRSPRSPLSMKSVSMSDSPRSPLSLSNRVFASERKKRVH